MTRVLSTQAARDAITKMQAIIHGGLTEEISRLQVEGRTLSQPEIWDGVAASQFRSIWESAEARLAATKADLEELRMRIDAVNANIMQAGGN